MLDANQIVGVLVLAGVGIVVLLIIYYVAGFILAHVTWIFLIVTAIVVAGIVYYFTHQNKP
jgi:hypothetical protein